MMAIHPLTDLPGLHSLAGAGHKLYLNFTGDYVAGWSPKSNGTYKYAPGFIPAGTETRGRLLVARYRAANPQPVSRAQVDAWARERLGPTRGGAGSVLLVR